MKDVEKMSNQERINFLGVKEASKHPGYGIRTEPVIYKPAYTEQGGAYYLAFEKNRQDSKTKLPKMRTPREFIIKTESFKKFKPEKKKQEVRIKNFKPRKK